MWAIFKTKMSIFQKFNSEENSLLAKITHHLDPEIRKMLVRGMFGNENATFHSGP